MSFIRHYIGHDTFEKKKKNEYHNVLDHQYTQKQISSCLRVFSYAKLVV